MKQYISNTANIKAEPNFKRSDVRQLTGKYTPPPLGLYKKVGLDVSPFEPYTNRNTPNSKFVKFTEQELQEKMPNFCQNYDSLVNLIEAKYTETKKVESPKHAALRISMPIKAKTKSNFVFNLVDLFAKNEAANKVVPNAILRTSMPYGKSKSNSLFTI
jgi:hypothetical protein